MRSNPEHLSSTFRNRLSRERKIMLFIKHEIDTKGSIFRCAHHIQKCLEDVACGDDPDQPACIGYRKTLIL